MGRASARIVNRDVAILQRIMKEWVTHEGVGRIGDMELLRLTKLSAGPDAVPRKSESVDGCGRLGERQDGGDMFVASLAAGCASGAWRFLNAWCRFLAFSCIRPRGGCVSCRFCGRKRSGERSCGIGTVGRE